MADSVIVPKCLSDTMIVSSMAKKTYLISVYIFTLLSSSDIVLALSHNLSAANIVDITQVLDLLERVETV